MSDVDREAMWELIADKPPEWAMTDWLLANRADVLRALGARRVYASQDWVDADGIHDGWRTGYGHYTPSRDDAHISLEWDRSHMPDVEFRIAQAWLTDWEDMTDE